jgi:hypothetical protein
MTYDSSVVAFRGVSLVLAGALGIVPLIPAEHAHETEANGHSRIVLHQHAQPHSIGHVPVGAAGGPVFDHPDDPVLTLSTVFIAPVSDLLAVPDGRLLANIHPPASRTREALIGLVEHPIHGPPRLRPSLRGPPHSLV